jgi:hypothetical protein
VRLSLKCIAVSVAGWEGCHLPACLLLLSCVCAAAPRSPAGCDDVGHSCCSLQIVVPDTGPVGFEQFEMGTSRLLVR